MGYDRLDHTPHNPNVPDLGRQVTNQSLVTFGVRQARSVRLLTKEESLVWIRELLQGDSDSLPNRVAGILLLLYAHPLA